MVFDTRSKMVMSQGGTAERMKEKVRRVESETGSDTTGLAAANIIIQLH